jgi:hypothetical protein
MRRLKRLSTSSAALLALSVLALGVLAATTLSALADHDVHSPGWNKPDPNVPTSLFDFRSGWGWDDYQRLWARSDNARRFPGVPAYSDWPGHLRDDARRTPISSGPVKLGAGARRAGSGSPASSCSVRDRVAHRDC